MVMLFGERKRRDTYTTTKDNGLGLGLNPDKNYRRFTKNGVFFINQMDRGSA